nr:hypothetical protein B0A51_08665 [Rachicladosporium sp. CCFEE 5018]
MSTQAMYECAVCYEDEIQQEKVEHVNDSLVCHTCISKQFRAALRNENDYPARLGTVKLSFSDYHHVLEPEFWVAYAKKEIEYDCPPLMRVYSFEAGHACDMNSRQTVVSEEQALAATGLIRGQDCQLCPNELCLRLIQMETEGCGFVVCTCGEGLCFFCGITWNERTQHECHGPSRATEQAVGNDSLEQSRASRADSGIPPDQHFDDNPAVIESRALLQPIVRIRHAMERDIRRLFPSGVPRMLRTFTTPPGHEGEVRVHLRGATIRDYFTHSMETLILEHSEDSLIRRISALSLILERIDWLVLDLDDNLDQWESQRRREEYAATISDLRHMVETMGLGDEEGRDLFSAFFQTVDELPIVEAE